MATTYTRRKFLGGLGLATAGAALAPVLRTRRAHAGPATSHLILVAIGGGLRRSESLGMAEGATMPNLFGTVPLISGFGSGSQPPARIAPEYAALAPPLVLPSPRPVPLYTQGALITNLRYAEGAPGHLQGQACLASGYYNNLENRADARLPVPTIYEVHRRARNAPATDAWYLTVPGGFYRALACSDSPSYGAAYGASYLQPPGVMSPIVPIVTSGRRSLDVATDPLPTIPQDAAEDAAVRRMIGVLDGNSPPWPNDGVVRATAAENAQVEDHLGALFADGTYQSYFPATYGIGLARGGGGVDSTPDALTIYHAEAILHRFRPSLMSITLLDIDRCHDDFNAYLRAQQIADALVAHLWDTVQADPELAGRTTLVVLPEHGRHLYMNGRNPDSFGRSGIDHGQGDDGDREVWMLALGPDIAPGVYAPTGITQAGRTSGRYETIDAVMTAMTVLGHGQRLSDALVNEGARPGLVIEEVMA
jgi:hypothetical protein